MANFKDAKTFAVHDDYYTRKDTWEMIKDYIPKDKVIFEAFSLGSNEQSIKYLRELGFNVVGGKNIDFFEATDPEIYGDEDLKFDMILSNPPYETTLKKKCLERIVLLDKPTILLMNSMNFSTKYFKDIFEGHHKDIKFIVPSQKINYDRYENGKPAPTKRNSCSFYTWFMCYKVLDDNIFL